MRTRIPSAMEAGLGQLSPTLLKAPKVSAEAYGSAAGELATQVGEGFEKIAQVGDNVLERQALAARRKAVADRRDAELSSASATATARVEWTKRLNELEANAPADGKGFSASALAEFGNLKRSLVDSAPSKLAGELLAVNLSTLEASTIERADAVERGKSLEFNQNLTLSMVEDSRNAVLLDPQSHGEVLTNLLTAIDASALPDLAKTKMARDATSALTEATWRGLAQRDPRGALRTLENEPIPGLDYGDRKSLLSEFGGEVRRLDAEARAASAARMQDLGQRVRFASDVIEQGLMVRDMDKLRREVQGTPLAADLAQAEATMEWRNTFATMDQATKAQTLDALTSAAQDEASIGRLKAAQSVLQADARDLQEGRVLERAQGLGIIDVQPLEISSPESFSARLDAARRAGAHFGIDPPLLTADERAGFLNRLAKAEPAQKVQLLADMQRNAGDSYPLLMRDLGGKGGLDRSSRYLSLLAGRPEAAPVINAVVEGGAAEEKDLELQLARHQFTKSDLDREVLGELEEFIGTVGATYGQGSSPAGGGASALIADVTETAKRTAMVLMRDHTPSEAVRMAVGGLINDRYVFRDSYRVPKALGQHMDRLDRMMSDTMAALSGDALEVPGSLREVPEGLRAKTYLEHVRSRGRWVTLPDESGLLLTDELGNAVVAYDRPVIVKFGGAS